MDLKTNIQRVEEMLINFCGCSYSEAIKVCEEMIRIFKLKKLEQEKQ